MTPRDRVLRRAVAHPLLAVAIINHVVRGYFYRVYYKLTGRRFVAGRGLRVEGRLKIRGPGRVIFGERVHIGETTCLWTYEPGAVIEIGERSYLNGTQVWCTKRVTIGALAIIGRAEILDTDFHSTHVARHDTAAPVRSRPIVIAENVWIAARAAILPGVSVGPDAVVGYGAVCTGTLQGGMIHAGNPARPMAPVPREPSASSG
jgi:acetyltransferase-like isoleucine patch superfamily enzyme